jgi:hypothetical protein
LSLPLSANKRGSSYFGSVAQLTIEDGQQNYILGFIDEVIITDKAKPISTYLEGFDDYYTKEILKK